VPLRSLAARSFPWWKVSNYSKPKFVLESVLCPGQRMGVSTGGEVVMQRSQTRTKIYLGWVSRVAAAATWHKHSYILL
jgi:hypothetical protein